MELLIIEDDLRAYPHPALANIEEFKTLIRRDRGSPGDSQGRKKQRAARELAYIYHMEHYESSYAGYAEDLRHEQLLKDLFHDDPDWEPDEVVEAARDKFVELSMTPLKRLLRSAIATVRKLEKYFDSVDFTEMDEKGRLIYDAKDVIGNISNLGKLVDGVKKLEEQVEKDEMGSNKNRRNVQTNEYSE